MQYDSPVTSASFQSFLDTASISTGTADAISALLNLDTAETVNYASWDGSSAPQIPTGQTAPVDVVVATIDGSPTDLVNVDLPTSLASAKAFVFDSNASLNVTIDAPAAVEASLLRVAVADAAPTTDFGLVVSTGAGNDVITTKGDQNTFIDGGNGNDTIVTGNGNNTVQTGEGNNNVTTGSGNDTIVLNGVAGNTNIVNAGAGYDVVQLQGSASDYTYATGNHNNVTLTGDQTAVISDAEFLSFSDDSTVVLAHSEAEASALRLYEGLLGRDAELEGAKYFSGQVEAGTSLNDIANQFLTSSEFAGKEASAHVNDLYLSLLGRNADDAGASDWAGAVANGSASLSDVAAAIAVSAEAQQKDASNGSFIHDLYTSVLGRDTDAPNVDGAAWVTQLFNGASRADVAAAITSSAEATAHNDSLFLDNLYQTAVGRDADAAGKADWATALANGATHADVAIAIVGSPEAVAHNDNVVVLHGAV